LRIVLTHPRPAFERYFGEEALARLEGAGEVLRNPTDAPLSTAALIERAAGAAVIVSDRQTPGEAALFEALPDLVAFVRVAMDIRNVDVPAADKAGVLVVRATAGFMDAVAELAIGFMIDLARGISRATLAYRSGAPQDIRMGLQLTGSTVGIVGYGAIGRRLGQLARALGMTVLASDPYRRDMESYVERVGFEDLLARSRFVVCLAPANAETEKLMNARAFAAMARDSYFVNLSRGDLVDEDALAASLASGHLAGAAMDVGRAPDQMPTPALAARSDVVATPHIGGLTPQAVAHQALEAADHVLALAAGRLPAGAVNAKAATRLERLGIGGG
jgi:D-3-phosphoglycerate dehydrogenase